MTLALVQERREVAVKGIVQGVGFRPFIHSLACRYDLAGLVRNDAAGVHIEAEGAPEQLELFLRDITEKRPPLAVVETVAWHAVPVRGERGFRIEESRDGNVRRALVSPDIATCSACLHELFDPADRRYRYPFINCTNCGPRFTIIQSVPYDRPSTTMADFTMCRACRDEYGDPADRRFHAQPNACPRCGPQVHLLDRSSREIGDSNEDPIGRVAELLLAGAIVAVKGLGGYHLACDPFNAEAVAALRSRKTRQDKPFALMSRDLAQVRSLCNLSSQEAELLADPRRPIVLLERHLDSGVVEDVAPRQRTLGVMLAYTPLHHLLLHDIGRPVVMTSGNRSDEPIAYHDDEMPGQIGHIADYFLTHSRPIHMRCDDTVLRFQAPSSRSQAAGHPYPIRRSRGYAPAPLTVKQSFGRPTLACGGEMKNTFCLAKDHHAFVSHHIGDLENYETLRSFREGIEHYSRLFDVRPELVAYDLHPEYLSTKYAAELEEAGLPAVGVQHHHAHIASCLADNQRPPEECVIGVALDGTGYGTDGAIWGGEFLEGSVRDGFVRRGHLAYAPLPGGEAAIRCPWRTAIGHLIALYGPEQTMQLPLTVVRRAGERNIRLIADLIRAGLNTPVTSSAGRLFDAVAALLDVPGSTRVTYEGQAAIELELAASGPLQRGYGFEVRGNDEGWVVETGPIIVGVVQDLLGGEPASRIAARFHWTLAHLVTEGCRRIRQSGGPRSVALSGGTFQNSLLLGQTVESLEESGFGVYLHRQVPPNDGGLSLGQAVLADSIMRKRNG
ncbi:MAG: carbamoyltransferase HypF [Chloroflexota bacterium]|nr:carbamoyltransferase HypF [Chloroflexota bacterium]